MKELWDFYSQAEKQFQVAMNNWEKETEGLTEEEEAMYSDSLIDERNKIESLLDRGHTLGISAVYTFLERFLNLIVEYLRAGGAPITESKQGFSLQKIRDLILEHTKLNIGRPPFDWKRLDQLREIRNCIVHTDGWITEDFKERLGEVGLTVKEDTRLVLPPKYFQKCWRLVNETWEFVYSHCSKEFGYRKQHELWLRPASTFTSDKLREILREAIAAGIAARKKAERKSEGSCGWVWLEIDRKLLKHIHKLQIPNISTSYNTTARVEDFHLYLNEVENHMHMGATIRGIEAAATVLENYGINSNVRSLAD